MCGPTTWRIHFLEIDKNHDVLQGSWLEFKGNLKEQWGKLTDDDLEIIKGKREQLLGRVQARHGLSREAAERQVTDWGTRNPNFFFEKSQ